MEQRKELCMHKSVVLKAGLTRKNYPAKHKLKLYELSCWDIELVITFPLLGTTPEVTAP